MNNIQTIEVAQVTGLAKRKKKRQKTGDAFVGKDILELISVSMYVEPLTIYREYIQNATDSIDAAVASGSLGSEKEGQIEVWVRQSERSITIRDNGEGVSSKKFSKIMLAFGASEKRGTGARGFRGVGRFAGLGYCQQLVFRTKSASENVVSEVEWDGHLLKRLLADNSEQLSIEDIVKHVAVFSQYESDKPHSHFFEVVLHSVVRMGNDVLLNEETVKSYISQVCPIPYSPELEFSRQLDSLLEQHNISTDYNILVKDDYSASQRIYRPYSNTFNLTDTESDHLVGIHFFEVEGVHGGVAAIGWIFQHNYKGVIPAGHNIRGVRVRVGNTQIGEENLMTGTFPEPRFNSWSMGEIHVLESKITPNGRRDSFDNNIHWVELQNQFSQHAKDIARVCRKNSAERNAIKQFNAEIRRAEQFQKVLLSDVLSKRKAKEIREKLTESLLNAEKFSVVNQLSEEVKVELSNVVKDYQRQMSLKKLDESIANEIFDSLPKNKAAAMRETFDFIFECSPNKVVAQSLIDKIVDQYKIRYR